MSPVTSVTWEAPGMSDRGGTRILHRVDLQKLGNGSILAGEGWGEAFRQKGP